MNYTKHHTDNFMVHTPSKVEFIVDTAKSFNVMLDDQFLLKLDPRHAVNGQLKLGVEPKVLEGQFLEGRYFIVDNKIIDHRLKQDLKFEHSTDSIKALVDHLGFAVADANNPFAFRTGRAARRGVVIDRPMARSETANFECDALGAIGGMFDVKIGFSWSPFSLDINSFIEMWRQICSNGAIAQDPIMNHRIPMMNQWQENLAISNQVIRHNFDKLVLPRLQALPDERINMQDVSVLHRMACDLKDTDKLGHDSYLHLANIIDTLDMVLDPEVSSLQGNLQKFIPAPISAFDAMNIATEMATHHVAADKSGVRAQAFVNSLIFDKRRQNNMNIDLSSLVTDTETFNNVDRAFFGETCH